MIRFASDRVGVEVEVEVEVVFEVGSASLVPMREGGREGEGKDNGEAEGGGEHRGNTN